MRALVTGANGFTGSYLVRHLLRKGYQVRGLVRPTSNLDSIKGLNIELVYADLAERLLSDDVVRGVEVIFHVAAAFRVEGVSPKYFWDVNVRGTKEILKAAKKMKVKRFVHCSTVGVQGDIKNPPAKEEDPYAPGDYYQRSKMEGEKLALEFYKKENLPVTIIRPTGIYGPGDLRFLKLFKFVNRGKFIMLGSGNVLYHSIFIDDLVEGIRLASENKKVVGEVITIGGDEYMTLNELVKKISNILDKPIPKKKFPVWPVWVAGLICEIGLKPFGIIPPLYRRRVNFFSKNRAFDISKATNLLGHRNKVSINKGLRLTAQWYKSQGLLIIFYLISKLYFCLEAISLIDA